MPDLNDLKVSVSERQFGRVQGGPIDLSQAELRRAGFETAWSSAQRGNTKASFAAYLGEYPNGRHAQSARASIAALERIEAQLAAATISKVAKETPPAGRPSTSNAHSGQRWPSADEPFVGADGRMR